VKIITFLLLAFFVSCAPPRWPLKPGPEDPKLTTMERSGIIENGWISRGDIITPGSFFYSWTERLSFMKPPVKVFSMAPVSHGVFREKWKNFILVVKDGAGTLYTLGEVALEQMTPGTVLR